jgi:hypothetical protein
MIRFVLFCVCFLLGYNLTIRACRPSNPQPAILQPENKTQ